MTDARRQAMMEASEEYWSDPKNCQAKSEAMSEAMSEYFSDPKSTEHREKLSELMRSEESSSQE